MPRTLVAPDGAVRNVSVTTTTKLAERILAASQVVVDTMPAWFTPASPFNILLELYLAEESASYLDVPSLTSRGCSPLPVMYRWVKALEDEGMVERRNDLLALTTRGYTSVVNTLEGIFRVQRALD